jgi:hypothetical protein
MKGRGWRWIGGGRIANGYIYLFAVYPVVFLYAQNLHEVRWPTVLLPMAVCLAFTWLLWLGLGFIFRSGEKRALAVFLVQLPLFYYKLIHDLLREVFGLSPAILIAGLLIVLLAGVGLSKGSLAHGSRVLSAILLLLVAWNAGSIVVHHLNQAGSRNARTFLGDALPPKPAAAASQPDIYLFIVDEFASLVTIESVFGHDHSRFARRLEDAGFFIARESRGLYVWTPEAIAAILNMEAVPEKADAGMLIKKNRVTRLLKEQGYRIFDFPHEDLTALEDSERHYRFALERGSFLFNDFYRMLVEMSLFSACVERWRNDDAHYARFFRQRILYVFETMPEFVKVRGPKFVLVHLFSPHAPFVFDRQGGMVPPRHHLDYTARKYYLDQYLYISRRLAEMVEMILKQSSTAPIIVLMSDHGYRGSIRKPFTHVVADEEKRKIFLALHLPGFPAERLRADMSPLNVFRMIFHHYSGHDLPEVP